MSFSGTRQSHPGRLRREPLYSDNYRRVPRQEGRGTKACGLLDGNSETSSNEKPVRSSCNLWILRKNRRVMDRTKEESWFYIVAVINKTSKNFV